MLLRHQLSFDVTDLSRLPETVVIEGGQDAPQDLRRLLAARRRLGPGEDPVQGRGPEPHAGLAQEPGQAGGAQTPDRLR